MTFDNAGPWLMIAGGASFVLSFLAFGFWLRVAAVCLLFYGAVFLDWGLNGLWFPAGALLLWVVIGFRRDRRRIEAEMRRQAADHRQHAEFVVVSKVHLRMEGNDGEPDYNWTYLVARVASGYAWGNIAFAGEFSTLASRTFEAQSDAEESCSAQGIVLGIEVVMQHVQTSQVRMPMSSWPSS